MKIDSPEDLRHSHGAEFVDPYEAYEQAQVLKDRLTRHRWLGRIASLATGSNPLVAEQEMRSKIETAEKALPKWDKYHYDSETGRLERLDERAHDSARQPLEQHASQAPAELPEDDYQPRHAADD